ncbi:hypothetical protein MTO96_040684 [Rhipicephalus appendiculatus]
MLATNTSFSTRCGTSASRGTTPDVTFVIEAAEAKWAKLKKDLGGDHYILAATPRVEQRRFLELMVTD